MSMSESLFVWSSLLPGFCVSQICHCGPRKVAGCLTDGCSSRLVVIDPHTGRQTAGCKLQSECTVVNIGCDQDGNQLLVFDAEGSVWSVDLRTFADPQQVIATKSLKQLDSSEAGTMSCDGRTVAMGTSYCNKTVKKKKRKARGRKREESSDSESDSEPFMHTVDIWDLRNTGSIVQSYSESHSETVQALSFSSEAHQLLISGDADGLVNIFDVRHKDEDDALQASNQLDCSISRAGFLPFSRSYATTDDNRFVAFRLNSADDVDIMFKKNASADSFLVDLLDESEESVCALFSSATGDATLQSYSNAGLELNAVLEFTCHEDLIRCVAYQAADRLLITGDESGTISGRELVSLKGVPGTAEKRRAKKRRKPYEK